MSVRQITEQNGLTLYGKTINTTELPTFAGITMASLDEYIQRTPADVLSADKIIIGDGTNKIKDSLAEVGQTGSINVPLDQGYWINSQPIVYQDGADSNKYKVEVHEGKFNTKIQTNSITSIGANDDISIDANGSGIMRFNTIVNNGCLFGGNTGGLGFNWAIKTTFDSALATDPCAIIGTATESGGGSKIAVVGSNDLQAANWTPLYMQPTVAPNGIVVLGDTTPAIAIASGSKLYSVGGISSSSTLKTNDNGGTNFHSLGGSVSGARVHTLQDATGTIAHLSDIATSAPKWSFGSQAGENAATGTKSIYFGFGDTAFNLVEIFVNVESGTTGHLEGRNSADSSIIFSIDVAGDGTLTYASTSSFSNVSGSKNLIIVDWTRIGGAGACNLYGARLF